MLNRERTGRERVFRWILRRRRRMTAFAAALPLFQIPACYPDLIGAINFELQSLINSVLINTVAIIISDLLGI
jgi:hypothetical protein